MPNRRSLVATVAAASLVAIALGSVVGVRLGDDHRPPHASAGGSADLDAPAGDSPSDDSEHRPGTKQQDGQQDGQEDGRVQEPVFEAAPTPSVTASTGQEPSNDGGVRVMPEAPGPGTDDELPTLDDPAAPSTPPAYERPAATAFARGRIVAGYPTGLLPSVPRSTVVSSSVAPSADRVQVALVGRRSTDPATVVGFYRDLLSGFGFRDAHVDAVGGAETAAFRRGADHVVVTVDPAPGRTYSVYANLVVSED